MKWLKLNVSKNQKIRPTGRKKKPEGFTLIEVMVSMVISAMLLVSVMGSYWILIKADKAAKISQDLHKETNFALIRISDNIRNESIDYAAYAAGKDCADIDIKSCQKLCVKNNFFEFREDNLWMNGQPLFSSRYKVDDVYFSTAPLADPFSNIGDRTIQIQPRTTIFIAASSKERPSIKIELQTTVSSRKYRP